MTLPSKLCNIWTEFTLKIQKRRLNFSEQLWPMSSHSFHRLDIKVMALSKILELYESKSYKSHYFCCFIYFTEAVVSIHVANFRARNSKSRGFSCSSGTSSISCQWMQRRRIFSNHFTSSEVRSPELFIILHVCCINF